MSSNIISKDVKSGWGSFFLSHATRTCNTCGRNRLLPSRTIVIDPLSFVIGGLGAAAIGSFAYESNEGYRETPTGTIVTNSIHRTINFPRKTAIRFITGGCIYVAVDCLAINTLDATSPFISGSVIGLCFAADARTSVLLGCILGMGIFSHIADMILYETLSRSVFEL